jgi:Pentapeptide repeats (8 copies)
MCDLYLEGKPRSLLPNICGELRSIPVFVHDLEGRYMAGVDHGESTTKGWDLFKWKRFSEPPEWFTAAAYGTFSITFLVVAATGILALCQFLAPVWISGTAPPAESQGRLVVIAALLTSPFVVWRMLVSHWQARAAQEQARNTLFSKAVEQLGATREEKIKVTNRDANGVVTETREESVRPNIEVRLGAIYAPEKLARDNLELHWPIMETLCAYVRENAGPAKPLPDEAILTIWHTPFATRTAGERAMLEKELGPPRVDVQAALSVIGRRSNAQRDREQALRDDPITGSKDAWRLDLTGCHLARVNLEGLGLEGARLEFSALTFALCEKAHLQGASFFETHLYGASLSKTHLEGAWLRQAHLAKTELWGTSLVDAMIDEADLETANGLDQDQLDSAWGDAQTKLPAGLTRPASDRWLSAESDAKTADDRYGKWMARSDFWVAEAVKRRRAA